jgi:hypothetical protein
VRARPQQGYPSAYEHALANTDLLRHAFAAPPQPVALVRVRRSNYDRARTVAALRQHIAADLVADVLIDGRSWDVPD